MATYYTNWYYGGSSPRQTGSMGSADDIRFRFNVTEAVDVVNNRSTFTVVEQACYYDTGAGYGTGIDPDPISLATSSRIPNNISYPTSGTKSVSPDHYTTKYVTIKTRTFTVNHNPDGTGTTTFTGRGKINESGASWISKSATITMTKINRLSTVSTNATDTTSIGNTISITITQVATGASYTHNLYYQVGSSGEIAVPNGSGIAASSVNFTIPSSILNYTNDTPSPLITIICYSVGEDGTTLGSTTTSFNVTVPSTYNPTIGTPTFSEQSSDVAYAVGRGLTLNGSFVQNMSKVRCTVTLTGKNGAGISSYMISCGSQSFSNAGNLGSPYTVAVDFDNIVTSGTQTVSISTTDSRGLVSSTNATFNVLDYNKPSFVVAPVAYRCNIQANYSTVAQSVPKVTINQTTFFSQKNQPGSYEFTYTSPSWYLDGTVVNMSAYGISISGTPTTGDHIVVDSGNPDEDGTFVRIRAQYRISSITGNMKNIKFSQGSGAITTETLPAYAMDGSDPNSPWYDSLKIYSGVATNSTVAFSCSLEDSFFTSEADPETESSHYISPYKMIVGPSFVLQSFFGDKGDVTTGFAGKGITWGRDAISAGWNFYNYKVSCYEGSYTKNQEIDGLITEKTNGIYVRYVK